MDAKVRRSAGRAVLFTALLALYMVWRGVLGFLRYGNTSWIVDALCVLDYDGVHCYF